jgi:uncharacterized membrane protein required for colicin V production
MSIFDFVIIFIIGICFLFSFYKGMVREVFSFLGYLIGYILAMDYYEEFSITLQSMISQEIMSRLSEFTIVFIIIKILVALFIFFIVKVVFDLIGSLIRKGVAGNVVMSFPDRIIGGVLGSFKGLVIIAIIMFPLSLFRGGYEKVTQGSIITPYLENMIHLVSQEPYGKKFMDLSPDIAVDKIQKQIKSMGDLDTIAEQIKDKKDELLDKIQSKEKSNPKEGVMENYTKEDKSKLKDLIESFSNQ